MVLIIVIVISLGCMIIVSTMIGKDMIKIWTDLGYAIEFEMGIFSIYYYRDDGSICIKFGRSLKIKIPRKKNVKKGKKYSIVEEMYNKKRRRYQYAVVFLSISAGIYSCMGIFLNFNFQVEVLLLLFVLIGLIAILNSLVSYRIKKGYYGTNYGESKEILYYLKTDKNRNDKNSGKKIFNDIDAYNKASDQISEVNGEPQY